MGAIGVSAGTEDQDVEVARAGSSSRSGHSVSDLKQAALRIFRETFAAIDIPSSTMRRKLARADSRIRVVDTLLDLAPFERICAIAIGKASVALASGLSEALLPDFHVEGIVVTPAPSGATASEESAIEFPHNCRRASRPG